MIVKNSETLEQAIKLVKTGEVWYQDGSSLRRVQNPDELRQLLQSRLDVDDIATVGLSSVVDSTEDYGYSLKLVKRERYMAKQKAARQWIADHPKEVKQYLQRAEFRTEKVVEPQVILTFSSR